MRAKDPADTPISQPADGPGAGTLTPVPHPPARRKRRWLRRLFILGGVCFVLLLGVIAAAPYVLTTRSGLDQLTRLASNQIVGWVEVDSVTLSWFAPVEARSVRVLDADGREVLTVDRVSAANDLLSAIFSGLDFGEVVIDAPQATLHFDAENQISLVQALQARNPSPPKPPSGDLPKPRGRILLTNGRVTATRAGATPVELGDINLDVRLDTLSALQGDFAMTFPDGVQAVGKVDVSDLADERGFRADRARGTLDLHTTGDVQLAPLTAVFAPDAAVSGAANVNVTASTEGGDARGRFAVELKRVQSQATAGTVAPVNLALNGDLSRVGEQLTAKIALTGDAGRVDADLSYDLQPVEPPVDAERIFAALFTGESITLPELALDVRGAIDLARLREAVPALLPSRPGSRITSGRLEITNVSIRGGAQPTATGTLALRDLAGTDNGRAVRVEPITIDVDASLQPGTGLRIGKAELKSNFAGVVASGGAAGLKAEFRASLARLQQELGQLLDLSALRLGGELSGQLDVTRAADNQLAVVLVANGNAVQIGSAGKNYAVQRLAARQNGAIVLRGGSVERFETTGDVTATGVAVDGAVVLDGDTKVEWKNVSLGDAVAGVSAELVRLTSSAANVDAQNVRFTTTGAASATADVQASADLTRLFAAVGRLAKMQKPPSIGGRLALNVRVSSSANAVALSGRGGIDALAIGSGASAAHEPRVNIEFDAALDSVARRLNLTRAAVTSAPLTAEISGSVDQYDGPCVLALRGRYDASWEQLTRLLHEISPATTTTVIVSGKSVSQFEISGPLSAPGVTPPFRGLVSGVDVGWSAAELYGVRFGPATLKPALRDGRLTLPSTTIAVADGRANLGASIDFTAADTTLVMPGATKLLDNVAITPLIGQSLLSHINPMFLHMTRVEGRVHLGVQDVFMPFGESRNRLGRGAGVLDLQSVSVQPSGLMGLLLELGGYASDRTHNVQFGKLDFVVRDGRIAYDNFTMVMPPDFDLRFRGSVGFDDTLDLVVSVPVREGLLRRLGVQGPALAAAQKLTGARVELPIIGTRERPQIDFKQVDVTKLLGEALVPDSPGKAVNNVLDILRQTQEAKPKKKKP